MVCASTGKEKKMADSKVLDFFNSLSKDESSAKEFKTITEELSTAENEASAKEILEKKLIPFAKSKGYDITAQDFLNFVKDKNSELNDDVLALASGGRAEIWNRVGQSLLIFGTGAGLFAGATFGATGGFGGGKSKSVNNRPAVVQTVDQNRRKELQGENEETKIIAKDDSFASSSKSSNRLFRNTASKGNRRLGNTGKVGTRGSYLNKANNLDVRSRVNTNAKSTEALKNETKAENKKAVENIKQIVKENKKEVVATPVKEVTAEDATVKKANLPKPDIKNKKGDELKKGVSEYLNKLDSDVFKTSGFLFWKKTNVKEDVNLVDLLETVIKDLKECSTALTKDNVDKNDKISKNLENTVKKCNEAIGNGLTALNAELSKTNWEKDATPDNTKSSLDNIKTAIGDTNNILKNYESINKNEATNLKATVEKINKAQNDLKDYEKKVDNIKNIKVTDIDDVEKSVKEVLDFLGKAQNNYIKSGGFELGTKLDALFKNLETELDKKGKTSDTNALNEAKEYAEKIKGLLNEVGKNKAIKLTLKLTFDSKNVNDFANKVTEQIKKIGEINKYLDEELKTEKIGQLDMNGIGNAKDKLNDYKAGFDEKDNLSKKIESKIEELNDKLVKLVENDNGKLDEKGLENLVKAKGNFRAVEGLLRVFIDNNDEKKVLAILKTAYEYTSDKKASGVLANYVYSSDEFLKLVGSEEFSTYLKSLDKNSELFKEFKTMFNVETSYLGMTGKKGIKQYYGNVETVNKLNEIVNAEEVQNQKLADHKKELVDLVKSGKLDEVKKKLGETLSKDKNYDDAFTIIDTAFRTTADSKVAINYKYASTQFFELISELAKDNDFIKYLEGESKKGDKDSSEAFKNFKELFNKENTNGIKSYSISVKNDAGGAIGKLDKIFNPGAVQEAENENHKKELEDFVNKKETTFNEVKKKLGEALTKKSYDDAFTIIDTAFRTTADSKVAINYKYASTQFFELISELAKDNDFIKYLEGESKKGDKDSSEAFKNFKELFNKENTNGIKSYSISVKNDAGGAIGKLNKIFNPNEAKQQEIEKHTNELKDLVSKNAKDINEVIKKLESELDATNVSEEEKNNYIFTIIDTAFSNTSDKIGMKYKYSSGDFINLIENANFKAYLQSDKSNGGSLYKNFEVLFNRKAGYTTVQAGIKDYYGLGKEKIIDELNTLINPKEAEEQRLTKVVEGKDIGKVAEELKNLIKNNKKDEIIFLIDNTFQNTGKMGTYGYKELSGLISTKEFLDYLEKDKKKNGDFHKLEKFSELYDKIKNYLTDKDIAIKKMDGVLNYTKKTKEDAEKIAKSGKVADVEKAIVDAIYGKDDEAIYTIVNTFYECTSEDITGANSQNQKYQKADLVNLLQNKELKDYLKEAKNTNSNLYTKFKELFNKQDKGMKGYLEKNNNNQNVTNLVKELDDIFNK